MTVLPRTIGGRRVAPHRTHHVCGTSSNPAWGAGRDATVITRLRAAGAVMLGKLELNEYADCSSCLAGLRG